METGLLGDNSRGSMTGIGESGNESHEPQVSGLLLGSPRVPNQPSWNIRSVLLMQIR